MRSLRLAASLVVLTGAAVSLAQPTLDGQRPADVQYVQRWLQNQPTSFGDNRADLCASVGAGVRLTLNNSNTAGVDGNPGGSSTGTGVTTGVEIAIPLSQLGNPAGAIRIAGWVNGGGSDYMSNQVIGGLPPGQGNLGGDGSGGFNGSVGSLNFDTGTYAAGTQFVSVANTAATDIGAITVDGTADGAYGAALWTNSNGTGFGDSNMGVVAFANGSEIDQLFAQVATVSVDGQPSAPYLIMVIAGNLESNFNHLNIFIDTGGAGGQNPVSNSNPTADGLDKHYGLTFDAGFAANYYMSIRLGGGNPDMYSDFAKLNPAGGGGYMGGPSGSPKTPPAVIVGTGTSCPPDDAIAVGSELDGIYSYLDRATRKLYIFAAGNVEQDEHLHLFLDLNGNPALDKGQRTIGVSGVDDVTLVDNVQIGIPDHLHKFAADGVDPGLTFESNFYADYWIGSHFENVTRMSLDAALLRAEGKEFYPLSSIPLDYGCYSGAEVNNIVPMDGTSASGGPTATPPGINLQDGTAANIFSGFAPRASKKTLKDFLASRGVDPFNPAPTQAEWETYVGANPVPTGLLRGSYRNNNVVGVTEASGAGAGAVTTGFEFELDLFELGWDHARQNVKLVAFIGNSSTTVISNQITGGAGQSTDLGNSKQVNLESHPGVQTIVVGFCLADFNQNGSRTVQDLFDFLAAWFAKLAIADFNGNPPTAPAGVTVQDLFDFLAAWFAGQCNN